MRSPRLICLLPVRNGEAELEGYLESVGGYADAVVALDDGSTDASPAMLSAHPLVKRLLRNPVRETFEGWDDAANRARLLEAAAELQPDWVISIDADERIPADDADALRRFLDSGDALPGCAFGLKHYRMWGPNHCSPSYTWIYRLFAFTPGQRFSTRRLHFDPVPTDIPRAAWIRTSLRLQHFGAADTARLATRIGKYRQADPEGVYGFSHGGLAAPPSEGVVPWRPRPPALPVLLPDPPRSRRRERRRSRSAR